MALIQPLMGVSPVVEVTSATKKKVVSTTSKKKSNGEPVPCCLGSLLGECTCSDNVSISTVATDMSQFSVSTRGTRRLKRHFGASKGQKVQLQEKQRKPRDVLVNLIPWNSTGVDGQDELYAAPSAEAVTAFCHIVSSYGLTCIVRKEMGQDIAGACGQLALINKGTPVPKEATNTDIEDLLRPSSRPTREPKASPPPLRDTNKGAVKPPVSHLSSLRMVALVCFFAMVALVLIHLVPQSMGAPDMGEI